MMCDIVTHHQMMVKIRLTDGEINLPGEIEGLYLSSSTIDTDILTFMTYLSCMSYQYTPQLLEIGHEMALKVLELHKKISFTSDDSRQPMFRDEDTYLDLCVIYRLPAIEIARHIVDLYLTDVLLTTIDDVDYFDMITSHPSIIVDASYSHSNVQKLRRLLPHLRIPPLWNDDTLKEKVIGEVCPLP